MKNLVETFGEGGRRKLYMTVRGPTKLNMDLYNSSQKQILFNNMGYGYMVSTFGHTIYIQT